MSKITFNFEHFSNKNKSITNLEFIRGVKSVLHSPEKWCKGSYENKSGACCLIGAAQKILPCGSHLGAQQKFNDAFYEAGIKEMPRHSIVNFNDHPDTTYDDIMDFLSTLETSLGVGELK